MGEPPTYSTLSFCADKKGWGGRARTVREHGTATKTQYWKTLTFHAWLQQVPQRTSLPRPVSWLSCTGQLPWSRKEHNRTDTNGGVSTTSWQKKPTRKRIQYPRTCCCLLLRFKNVSICVQHSAPRHRPPPKQITAHRHRPRRCRCLLDGCWNPCLQVS